jgi:hypothetical protein
MQATITIANQQSYTKTFVHLAQLEAYVKMLVSVSGKKVHVSI